MNCEISPGDYVGLRFALMTISAAIAFCTGFFVKHDHARYLSIAFAIYVTARIIRQFL